MTTSTPNLPKSLLSLLDEIGFDQSLVHGVVAAATPKCPWVLSGAFGEIFEYATLATSSKKLERFSTLAEALDFVSRGFMAPAADSNQLFELVPAADGSAEIAKFLPHPLKLHGQIMDLLILTVPVELAFSTEQMVGVKRMIQAGLSKAQHAGAITVDLQVAVVPEGCQLQRLRAVAK